MNPQNKHESCSLTWRELGMNAQNALWMLTKETDQAGNKLVQGDSLSKEKQAEKPKKRNKLFFFQPIKKHEGKGTQVYTPDGYGVLQEDLTKDKTGFKVKVKGVVNEYASKMILTEIPICIRFMISSVNSQVSILIPVNSISKDIFKRAQSELELNGLTFFSPKLFLKGKELNPLNELSLEQLGIRPKDKLLVTSLLMKSSFKVSRFNTIHTDWGYGNSLDAISFSPSRDIYVVGFGVYRPFNTEGVDLKTVAKIFDGPNCESEPKSLKEVMIPFCSSDENLGAPVENAVRIFRVNFDKPVKVKADTVFSCSVQIEAGSSFYGDGGKDTIMGEGEVEFKFISCESSKNGTGIDYGQIPEIYYFV